MIKKTLLKVRLHNAFRSGELCYSTQRNGQTLRKYPSIINVRNNEEKTSFVFILPNGLNPAELRKKEFIFSQYFGMNYELKGEGNKFALTIYKHEVQKILDYEFEKFDLAKKKLPIIAGMDRNGTYHTYDMVKHPHLLIAGETGSGKSTTIRAIVSTLVQHMREGLDLYLADMKRSEFHVFRHVDTVKAVVNKKTDVYKCLKQLQKEAELRGDLLDSFEVEHIDEYNKLPNVEKKNYILLCIDEVFILKNEKDSMEIITELSCIGRALGMFLILSMQRPDAKLLDGQLKNNLTVRYAFQMADKINSDIVLGRGSKEDASRLERAGQFYFKADKTLLLQAPYLEMENAKVILEEYKIRKHEGNKDDIIDVEGTEDFAPLELLGGEVHEQA